MKVIEGINPLDTKSLKINDQINAGCQLNDRSFTFADFFPQIRKMFPTVK
jgi:hypothetical protein